MLSDSCFCVCFHVKVPGIGKVAVAKLSGEEHGSVTNTYQLVGKFLAITCVHGSRVCACRMNVGLTKTRASWMVIFAPLLDTLACRSIDLRVRCGMLVTSAWHPEKSRVPIIGHLTSHLALGTWIRDRSICGQNIPDCQIQSFSRHIATADWFCTKRCVEPNVKQPAYVRRRTYATRFDLAFKYCSPCDVDDHENRESVHRAGAVSARINVSPTEIVCATLSCFVVGP